MKLLIVESPRKKKAIQEYLGEGWRVEASYGHIRDLPDREMGLSAPAFELEYVVSEDKAKVVNNLRALARSAERVYLATDPDREGEAIAWHLKDALGVDERLYDRVTFNAISKSAVNAAVLAPRRIDDHLVEAQEARRALDRLVGYMVSPILWDRLGPGASAGRVQSPAVRLVVDRENEITGFSSTTHFGARLAFAGGKWTAEWDAKPHLQGTATYNLDRSLADDAAACRDVRVIAATGGIAKKAPPPPFTTSTLMQAASAKLKFDTKLTASLAQKLFDSGLISYHRTDANNLADESIAEIRAFAASQGWELPASGRKFKEKSDAQAAHEGIRPLQLEDRTGGASADEQALYRLVWERAVASQLADATYMVTELRLAATGARGAHEFAARGRVMRSPGWKVLTIQDAAAEAGDEGDGDEESGGQVPNLDDGATVTAESGQTLTKATKPPLRYTEAKLVRELEHRGIGRPSTFASIISTVQSRGYLVMESDRTLRPTPAGVDLIASLLTADFAFIEYGFTRKLEDRLDAIAAGQESYLAVVGDAHRYLVDEIERVRVSGALPPRHTCPKCGKALRRVRGAKGVFWSCAGYRETGCDVAMDDDKGVPVPRKSAPCPQCNGPMYRLKGSNGFFWGCAARETCKTTLPDDKGKPGKRAEPSKHSCPACTRALVRRTKTGKKGFDFFGCTGYPACTKTYKPDAKGNPVIASNS